MFRPFNMTTDYDASPNDTIEIYKNHLSYIFAIWTMKIFSVVILRLGFYLFSGTRPTRDLTRENETNFIKLKKFWNGRWFERWIWNENTQTGQFKQLSRKVWVEKINLGLVKTLFNFSISNGLESWRTWWWRYDWLLINPMQRFSKIRVQSHQK